MNKLRSYRASHGISQEDFGKSVGVKKATISRIETGKRTPSMSLIVRMSKASKGALNANDFMPKKGASQ